TPLTLTWKVSTKHNCTALKERNEHLWYVSNVNFFHGILHKTKEVGVSDSMSYAVLVAATLFLGIGLQIAWLFFSNFIKRKRLESRISEVSIAIGKNAKNPENEAYVLNYLKEKFSPERFENRITDALGLIISVIHIPLSLLITVWYFAMIAGRIFGFMNIEPVVLWVPMILQLLLSIAIFIFSVFIKIVFGRYPGEANGFNKEFIKTIK
ncbi:hypothetical protein, partial [Salmonella enterica]|uniref:hypothetical protein n=1 Tax=Salmonella enterica TaxID=28901 RepID=UPI000B0622F1